MSQEFQNCVYCGAKPNKRLDYRTTGFGSLVDRMNGNVPKVPSNFTDSDIAGLVVCNGCYRRKYPEHGPSISARGIEEETEAMRAMRERCPTGKIGKENHRAKSA